MQDLYPIIRRKRRPLIVADAPPVAAVNVEPVNVGNGLTASPNQDRSDTAPDTRGCIASSSSRIAAPTSAA